MKLCIDARPLLGNMTGIANYVFHIVKNISQIDHDLTIKCFYASIRARRKKLFANNDKIEEYRYMIPNRLLNYFWSYAGLPKVEWLTGDVDVIHATNYYYMPHKKKARLITTVHDINFLKYRHFASKDIKSIITGRLGKFLIKSNFIITPSNSVKNDILEYFRDIDESKIKPIYHGIDPIYSNHERNMDPIISDDYILAVGSFIPRKNFNRLIKAFSQISSSELKDTRLVIAGPVPGKVRADKEEYARKNIIIYDYISQESLINLYKYAKLFVMPSLDEGFCFPVIEAQSMGIPVVISDIPVFREIAGDSALYFSPMDTGAIADRILYSINNAELRKDLVQKGYDNLARYNWSESARKHLELYERCL